MGSAQRPIGLGKYLMHPPTEEVILWRIKGMKFLDLCASLLKASHQLSRQLVNGKCHVQTNDPCSLSLMRRR